MIRRVVSIVTTRVVPGAREELDLAQFEEAAEQITELRRQRTDRHGEHREPSRVPMEQAKKRERRRRVRVVG